MIVDDANNISSAQLNNFQSSQGTTTANSNQDNRQTKTRLRVRIPRNFRQEPVISRLVSEYGLTINIAGAILGANAIDDGWFDLELSGTAQQIKSARFYMNDLDLEVLPESKSQEYRW